MYSSAMDTQANILVVDDDRILTELVGNLLKDQGYTATILHNGQEAYESLQNGQYHCMLLDIHMPGLNGAELLMLMAAENIPVPTFVIAAFHDFDEQEMKQFPNVRGLIHKPFYPDEILAAVKKCLDGSTPS